MHAIQFKQPKALPGIYSTKFAELVSGMLEKKLNKRPFIIDLIEQNPYKLEITKPEDIANMKYYLENRQKIEKKKMIDSNALIIKKEFNAMKHRIFDKEHTFLMDSYLNSVKNLKSQAAEENTKSHPLYKNAKQPGNRSMKKSEFVKQQQSGSQVQLRKQSPKQRYKLDALFQIRNFEESLLERTNLEAMREYNTHRNENSLSNRSASLSPTQDHKIIHDDFTVGSMFTQDATRSNFYPTKPSKFKQGSDGGASTITNSPYFDGIQFQKERILYTRGTSERPSITREEKLIRIPNLTNKLMSATQYGRFGQQRSELQSTLEKNDDDYIRNKGINSFQCSISKQSDYQGSLMESYLHSKDQTLPVLPQQTKIESSSEKAPQFKRSSMTSNYPSFFSTSPQRNRGISASESKQSGSSSPNYKDFRSLYKRTNFLPLKRKYSPEQYLSRKKDSKKLVAQTYLDTNYASVKNFVQSPSQSPDYRNFYLLPKSSSNNVKEQNSSQTNFKIQLLKVEKGKQLAKGQESANSVSRERNIYKICNSSPQPNSKKISSSKVSQADGLLHQTNLHNRSNQDQTESLFINSSLHSQFHGSPIQDKLLKINDASLLPKSDAENASRLFEFRRISKPLMNPPKQSLFNEIRRSVERLKQEITLDEQRERAYSGKQADFGMKDVYLSSAERKNRMVASRVLPTNETIEPILGDSEVVFKKAPGTAGMNVSRRGIAYRKKMTIRDLEGGAKY